VIFDHEPLDIRKYDDYVTRPLRSFGVSAAPLRRECLGGLLIERVEKVGRDARAAAWAAMGLRIGCVRLWRPLFGADESRPGINLRV